MKQTLYWNTVSASLRSMLEKLMQCSDLDGFRLVGGTALSLQLGHRMSVDIDLFTGAAYDSVDFALIDNFLNETFEYVSESGTGLIGFGKSYIAGNSPEDAVKLDFYYTEPFIHAPIISDGVRMARLEDIIAMKIDVVQRTGRKKDFWDLHELMDKYSPKQMIAFHKQRYPYTHDESLIRSNFTSFSSADEDFEPICLRGKYWEIIKSDIIEALG